MDRLIEYRDLIKSLLSQHVEICNRQPRPGVEHVMIADDERGHYVWAKIGWADGRRVEQMNVYVRLRNGKFWIEEDWTEDGIATDLLAAGVPHQDIVLAFHAPEMRPYTEFAAA